MVEGFQSEFNYGVSKLQAIRGIENLNVNYSLQKDYGGWLRGVKALHRELAQFMKPEEKTEAEELLKEAERVVARTPSLYVKPSTGQEQKLSDAEMFLKKIIRMRGLDMPEKADAGESLMTDESY